MYDREYEYIAAISKTGTLSGAAAELGVSQPALSRFLKNEEAELGTALFQRICNRMVLTYAGECYMEHVEQILAIQARMQTTIHDIAKMDQGRLRVGIPSIRRPFTIFSVIPEFKEKYPAIDLTLNEQASNTLEEMLENLDLDCIAVNVARQTDLFEYVPIAKEHYVLAVHADSPLYRMAQQCPGYPYPVIRPEQLENASFILLGKEHRIRQFADTILSNRKIPYTVSMHSRTLDGALEAVSNGLGCTFTPEIQLSYIRGSKSLRYLSLDAPGTEYEFSLLYRRGAYLPPSTKDFMRMFLERFRTQKAMDSYA
ncbi:MAG: LysR family transcriptional regulator [Lawsonibacter sp.]|nr:LysR family transcriptional regulator [Lawsonibacter sp.]